MINEDVQIYKNNIIAVGRLLWEKELVSGLNGNISRRIDEETILLTAHGTCLGLLQEKDIIKMKLDGTLLEEGSVSTEKLLHTKIYKSFPEATAVVHTHTTFTNAYFLVNETLVPKIFEAKMYLGEVRSVSQNTPAVTDPAPVMASLKQNNITVLRNHGVVAKGNDLFDCFLLIQALEEAAKIDTISRLYTAGVSGSPNNSNTAAPTTSETKKYKLFSQEQINNIVDIVNKDDLMKELGVKTGMTMDLAICLNETGKVYKFFFQEGRIGKVSHDNDAEFLISASEPVWRAVFNREIDPFVATTQKKMNLKGDFAKISKWYAPCSRIFELWSQVPIE